MATMKEEAEEWIRETEEKITEKNKAAQKRENMTFLDSVYKWYHAVFVSLSGLVHLA